MATTYDYAKSDYYYRHWYKRFARYVERHGLPCQECGGLGGEVDPICDDGCGPWEMCLWCQGTGLVTRWLRGEWLRYKKEEKKETQCQT